jgi:anti-anti-sigma factor
MTETTGQSNKKKTVINCASNLDISDANNLHRSLESVLENAEAVEIDTSKCERVDTAAIQCFYAFYKEAQKSGLKISWLNVSDAFRQCTETLGLDEMLAV